MSSPLCTALDFAQQRCAPNSQAGLITIRADYEGDSEHLLGTAPIYAVEPARMTPPGSPSCADPGHPDLDPGLCSLRDRLRPAVHSLRDHPDWCRLTKVDMTFWGFPAVSGHDMERFAMGSAENPPGARGSKTPSCITEPTAHRPCRSAVYRQSLGLRGRCRRHPRCRDLPGPGAFAHAEGSYPVITECERQTFQPVSQGELTNDEADSPSGLDLEFTIPQAQGLPPRPPSSGPATLILPEGLTINPDAADGQSACTRRRGRTSATRSRRIAPTTPRSGPSTSTRRRSTGR